MLQAVPAIFGKEGLRADISGAFDVVPLEVMAEEIINTPGTRAIGEGCTSNDETHKEVQFLHHIGGVELPLSTLQD
jgi:hypothetical protein